MSLNAKDGGSDCIDRSDFIHAWAISENSNSQRIPAGAKKKRAAYEAARDHLMPNAVGGTRHSVVQLEREMD
jgi:hypothetical protein